MTISELAIRRPVFATVLSLLVLLLGVMAALRLPIREYPDVQRPIVSVTTFYRGASPEVVETRITQLIEDEVSGIEGVEKLESESEDERSRITVEFAPDRDLDSAANDVRERVSRVLARLPDEADAPQILKVDDGADVLIYINLDSTTRDVLELTDYAERFLVDRFSSIPGVAGVRVSGARRYAMRVWLNREALAARALTVADIEEALRRENVEIPAGRIESVQREFSLRTDTALRRPEDFRALAVGRSPEGYVVRLGEVADIELAAEDLRSIARTDGRTGISLGILPTSTANVLDVAQAVQGEITGIARTLPKDMRFAINMDFSVFIVESMRKVLYALLETLAIVLAVIFLFLGTVRATLMPALTIPVSIFGAAIFMATFGYSINTLTLLGAVLAIGLVVDDAIVVLENIARRVEQGEPALLAASNGSREIGFAVIATTAVLIAVFLPVAYLPGTLGRLFGEFGVSVAAAVAVSALIALTLTPMMASKLFASGIHRGAFAQVVDSRFRRLAAYYRGWLSLAISSQRAPWVVGAAAALALLVVMQLVIGWPFAGLRLKQEFAPKEDRAMLPVMVRAPEGASITYLDRYLTQIEQILAAEVARGNAKRVLARSGAFGRSPQVNVGTLFLPLNLWDQRSESAAQIAQRIRAETANIAGVRVMVFEPPSLNVRGQGQPLQVVLGAGDYGELAGWAERIMARVARENPGIIGMDSDYQETKPQVVVRIDREKAADLGVSLANIGRTLETMMGSRNVTTFNRNGEEYNVVLQARAADRTSVGEINNIYVRAEKSGELIALGGLVHFEEVGKAAALKRFDRLRAVTLSANLAPNYTLGEALDYMDKVIAEEIPAGAVRVGYDGESREYKRSGGALWLTFGFALLIVYLVLAAQFESFVHPLVILASVPLAITGALLGLAIFGASLNVFSQIGAIMLIGIACKNGILIVEFANQLRDRGMAFADAIVEAGATRLRPVLMTSFCTAFGVVPLMLASGAGAESRRAIGAAVFFGTIFAALLTLFVVPALYSLIAKGTQSPHYVSRLLDGLRGPEPQPTPAAAAGVNRE
ncbi:MAG: efflux RND transporter permease subunit [Steroidobacteraceae bacterium]